MNRLQQLFPFFLVLAIAIAAIIWLFPEMHPHGGIRLTQDARAVIEQSRAILQRMDIDLSDANPEIRFEDRQDFLPRLQQKYGLRQANALVRDSSAGYSWSIRWTREKPLDFRFGGRSEKEEMRDTEGSFRGDVTMRLDLRGQLLAFDRRIADSVRLPSLSIDDARQRAQEFIRRYTDYAPFAADSIAPATTKTTDQPQRKDHQFTWPARMPMLDIPVTLKISVAGTQITAFSVEAERWSAGIWDDVRRIVSFVLIFLFASIGIAMVVVAVRRIRAYEIGFRMALVVGALTALVFDIEIYLSVQNRIDWELLLPLLITPVFIGGAMVLLWAVAESAVRESWREKFVSLDLIVNGHLLHSRIGENTIRGIAIGAAILALQLGLTGILNSFTPLWISKAEPEGIKLFTMAAPGFYALGHGFYMTVFPFAFFAVFLMSFLRKYFHSALPLIAIAAAAMGALTMGDLFPLPLAFLQAFLCSAIILWAFYRYEALTAFLGMVTWTVLQDAGTLIVSGPPPYLAGGMTIVGFLALLIAASMVTLFRRKEITEFDEVLPAFARHISERQRLQQELEIARSVQMSFLPKKNPDHSSLDIASRCAPALEVGGDYYDFIELSGDQLGVAIGDVSGKGTQAAFFMTLTKGFLRALANVSGSPAAVLTQVNRLFYESVERGMFISMVYGVFDMTQRTLTLARAGHNPVIMRKSQERDVQSVNPMGLALGLDPGETFAKSIREVTIPFQSGDLFVFYTDGFPEAMNKKLEEFGEERLARTVETYATGTAVEVMDGIFRDMRAFTGNAKQHDDMTIVVVKIK